MSKENPVVIFKEHKKSDGTFIGEIKLNSPRTLNALSLEMILLLKKKVELWHTRPDLSLLFLHGEGEKAFCAGGDVKSLYYLMKKAKENGQDAGLSVREFFSIEYELDQLLHHFPKPIVTWGGGLVMGGGLGLFMASSHALITDKSLFAMPEIHIGLFPDVGGTYFLSRLPYYWGWYVALTAHLIPPEEALLLPLGKFYFEHSQKEEVFKSLLGYSFKNQEDLNRHLQKMQKTKESSHPLFLEFHKEEIQKLCESKNIHTIHKNFKSFFAKEDKFSQVVAKDKENFFKASPSSLGIICEQLRRGESLSLKEAFQMELILAQSCARHFDFQEGVRALLVDKTKDPKWNPASVEDITDSWINKHFN